MGILGEQGFSLIVIAGIMVVMMLLMCIPAAILFFFSRSAANDIQRNTMTNVMPLFIELMKQNQANADDVSRNGGGVTLETESWDQ